MNTTNEERPTGDLISREALKKHILEIFEEEVKYDIAWAMGLKHSLKIIDLTPTVDVDIELAQKREKLYEESKKLYMLAKTLGKDERPQGNLANEVWKLYEKYHSHLATSVLEFGDELKELLGKYQEGGAE